MDEGVSGAVFAAVVMGLNLAVIGALLLRRSLRERRDRAVREARRRDALRRNSAADAFADDLQKIGGEGGAAIAAVTSPRRKQS